MFDNVLFYTSKAVNSASDSVRSGSGLMKQFSHHKQLPLSPLMLYPYACGPSYQSMLVMVVSSPHISSISSTHSNGQSSYGISTTWTTSPTWNMGCGLLMCSHTTFSKTSTGISLSSSSTGFAKTSNSIISYPELRNHSSPQ